MKTVFFQIVVVVVVVIQFSYLAGVAEQYGTTAAHIQHHAFVFVVFVVFCTHMYSFAGLIRTTPLPIFSDTAITNCHSGITVFQFRAHWMLFNPSLL